MDPRRLAEDRSLAFHAAVTQRLLADPSVLTRARVSPPWLASGHVHVELSKYFAGRDRDLRFTRDAALARLARVETLIQRVDSMPIDDAAKARIRHRIAFDFSALGSR